MKKKVFWIIVTIVMLLLLGNIAVTIWFGTMPTKTDWLTMISGWISGISTLVIGIIAFLQAKYYKKLDEDNKNYIDISAENIKITTDNIPSNYMGRIATSKTNKECMIRFQLFVYSYYDSPVFELNIDELYKNDNKVIAYDDIQPIQKDAHGKRFLTKYEFMYLSAGLPYGEDINGNYKLILSFKNQSGILFKKQIDVEVNEKILPDKCINIKQYPAEIIETKDNKYE